MNEGVIFIGIALLFFFGYIYAVVDDRKTKNKTLEERKKQTLEDIKKEKLSGGWWWAFLCLYIFLLVAIADATG